MTAISYTADLATIDDLRTHLAACDASFIPPLGQRQNLQSYGEKLLTHASRFEAWEDEHLVGLVAVYCNDAARKAAHITNVSVAPGFVRRGIARHLMRSALIRTSELGFSSVTLEVNERANAALAFYSSMHFAAVGKKDSTITMQRILGGRAHDHVS